MNRFIFHGTRTGSFPQSAKRLFNQITDEIIIASDTVVIPQYHINKPADAAEACSMLTRLSGKTHTVITAVCRWTGTK